LRGKGKAGVCKPEFGSESTIALMPRGSNFLLLRQKKVTKEKATPKFALIRDVK